MMMWVLFCSQGGYFASTDLVHWERRSTNIGFSETGGMALIPVESPVELQVELPVANNSTASPPTTVPVGLVQGDRR